MTIITPFTGRHQRRHLLDRRRDRLAEEVAHYERDGIVRCDGHQCERGRHARAEGAPLAGVLQRLTNLMDGQS